MNRLHSTRNGERAFPVWLVGQDAHQRQRETLDGVIA